MDLQNSGFIKITIIVLIVLVLYLFFTSFISSDGITGLLSGDTETSIDASKMKGDSLSTSYSIWIYVSDWTKKYDSEKIIFSRGDALRVYLGKTENNVNIELKDNNDVPFVCKVKNVPLQKWVNIITVVNGKTLDVYFNGKLVKTCLMNITPAPVTTEPLKLTPAGGFAGYTTRLKFWNKPIDPQTAWNTYVKGNGQDSFLSNFFSQTKLKVALMDGESESSSFIF